MSNRNHTLPLIAAALIITLGTTLFSLFDSPKYNSLDAVYHSTVVIVDNNPVASEGMQNNASGEKININTATAEELTKLKSIGQKKAQAIVDYRNENGKFRDVYELAEVSGISTKIIEQNLHLLTV